MPNYEVEITGPLEAELSQTLDRSGWTAHPQPADRTLLRSTSGAAGRSIFRILDLLNRSAVEVVGVRQLEC